MSPNVSFSSPQRSPSERASEYECCPYRKMRIRQTVFFSSCSSMKCVLLPLLNFSFSWTFSRAGPCRDEKRRPRGKRASPRGSKKLCLISVYCCCCRYIPMRPPSTLFFFSSPGSIYSVENKTRKGRKRREWGEETVCPALNDLKKD